METGSDYILTSKLDPEREFPVFCFPTTKQKARKFTDQCGTHLFIAADRLYFRKLDQIRLRENIS